MGNCQFKSESEQDNIKSKFYFKLIVLLLQIICFLISKSKYTKKLIFNENLMIFWNGYYCYYLIKDIGINKIKNKNLLFLTVILLYQSV